MRIFFIVVGIYFCIIDFSLENVQLCAFLFVMYAKSIQVCLRQCTLYNIGAFHVCQNTLLCVVPAL